MFVRLLSLLLMLVSTQAYSYGVACQLVAQVAGNKEYKAQPLRMASLVAPKDIPVAWQLSHLESHGAWHVYQAAQAWLTKEQCAPLNKLHFGKSIEFVPVILNQRTGHNAVITGSFIIQVYRKQHIPRIIERYQMKMLSPLPNPRSMIVDVGPVNSYDNLIKTLDLDKDVKLAIPIVMEPSS